MIISIKLKNIKHKNDNIKIIIFLTPATFLNKLLTPQLVLFELIIALFLSPNSFNYKYNNYSLSTVYN